MDRVSATDVDLALLLADVATTAALPFVADAVAHEAKADGSPVSKADWAAEAAMLEVLARSVLMTASCRRSRARWRRRSTDDDGCSTRWTASSS